MELEILFQAGSMAALAGWLSLLTSPWIPAWADRVSETAIPLLLSVAYAALVMAFWSGAAGGFDSLANVMRLFGMPEIALAGWLHYLAFDLFVGAWEVRTARAEGIAFPLVVPCLALTFMLGPAGFLTFAALRAAHGLARSATPIV
jgi:hypothetical protein